MSRQNEKKMRKDKSKKKDKKKKRKKPNKVNSIKNLSVFFISILLFLIIAELVSRNMYDSPSFLVKLGAEMHTTGAEYRLSDDKVLLYEGLYTSNKYLSPENHEKLINKEENVFRILILGDSVAASFINSRNQYFSDELEDRLNKEIESSEIQVVNSAVGGYNTIQEARYFEKKGIELNPDLVLVLVSKNDFDMLSGVVREKDGNVTLIAYKKNLPLISNSSISLFLAKHSYFYRMINEMIANIAKKHTGTIMKQYLIAQEENKAAMKKIINLCKENNILPVIVLFPSLNNFNNYPYAHFHNEVKLISTENSAYYLDLFSYFLEYDYKTLRLEPQDDTHPNQKGYDIAITGIIDYLKKEKLIPE